MDIIESFAFSAGLIYILQEIKPDLWRKKTYSSCTFKNDI